MQTDKLWNSNYNRVMLNNFALFFAFYLLTPLLPLYLSETFHATKDTIGIVLSGYTLVALLMRPISGFVADSFPRRQVLLVCLFFYFLFFGGYLLAGSLVWFALLRTLHGGPFGASTVANSTMAIDVLAPSRRNEGIGLYGLSNNLASAIAPTIGIALYQYCHDFDLLFWLAFAIAGLGFVNTLGIHPPQGEQQVAGRHGLSWRRFFLVRGWFIALNICFFGFCWGVLSNYLAIYSKERLGITSGSGTYFMLLSAGLIISRLTGNRTLRQGRMLHNALLGILLSTAGYLLFVVSPNLWGYYLSSVLIGFGNGHLWPAFQNMIIAVARPYQRGTANSTLLTSWDLGLGLGILMGGVIAEHLGYDAAFWMTVIVHFAGLASFWLITRRKYQS